MENDVNLIGFQNAKVSFGHTRYRSPEENIGDIGGDMHAGIVAQGNFQTIEDDVYRVSINTHMSGVKHGNNGTVDGSRIDGAIFKLLFSAFGDVRGQPTAGFGSDVAKVIQSSESYFFSQSINVFTFSADTNVFSNSAEFCFVFYFEVAGFTSGSGQ